HGLAPASPSVRGHGTHPWACSTNGTRNSHGFRALRAIGSNALIDLRPAFRDGSANKNRCTQPGLCFLSRRASMLRGSFAAITAAAVCIPIFSLCIVAPWQSSFAQSPTPALSGRVIAVGIAGAGAVSPVGTFHPGGPFHDKPEFAAFTQPGKILDGKRVLVAGSSNFGAPRAHQDQAEGSVLSIDPTGPTVVVAPNFASSGGQASALDGRVQLFTAQSPPFLNSVTSPNAASASQPAVSNPLGISINN